MRISSDVTRRESACGRRARNVLPVSLTTSLCSVCLQVKHLKEGAVYEGEFFSPLAAYLPGLLPKQAEVARYIISLPHSQNKQQFFFKTTTPSALHGNARNQL